MTINLKRLSPIELKGRIIKTENRDGWRIVSGFAGEGKGPHIVDLSHFPRWDIQDKTLDQTQPYGTIIPKTPGQILRNKNLLIGRLNVSQAIAWHFSPVPPVLPQSDAFTDITDAAAALALVGPSVFSIAEKLCALDIVGPSRKPPFLVQGPFSHVPCHIWILACDSFDGCFALSCSRGYGHNMVSAILEAGAEFNISAGGEDLFRKWLE
jgi:hypothetical protein